MLTPMSTALDRARALIQRTAAARESSPTTEGTQEGKATAESAAQQTAGTGATTGKGTTTETPTTVSPSPTSAAAAQGTGQAATAQPEPSATTTPPTSHHAPAASAEAPHPAAAPTPAAHPEPQGGPATWQGAKLNGFSISPAKAQGKCCAVALHAKASEIDAALMGVGMVGGSESKEAGARAVAARFTQNDAPLNPTALQRHKKHLLDAAAANGSSRVGDAPAAEAARVGAPALAVEPPTPPPVAADASDAHALFCEVKSPPHALSDTPLPVELPPVVAEAPTVVVMPVATEVAAVAIVGEVATNERAQVKVDPPAKYRPQDAGKQIASHGENHAIAIRTGERVGWVATLLHTGAWKDTTTVQQLTAKWGVSEGEVMRIHAIAAAKVRAHRGSAAGQLELSVARWGRMRDAEMKFADECEEACIAAFNAKEVGIAFAAKKLCGLARASAMKAMTAMDEITIARAQTLTITLGASAHPDFAAAWRIVAKVLDARFPGASQMCEDAMAVQDEHGEAGVDRWLDAGGGGTGDEALLLEAGSDGDFGAPGGVGDPL